MLNNQKLQAFLAIGPFILFIACIIGYFFFIFGAIGISATEDMEIHTETGVFPMVFAVGMGIFFALFLLTCAISMFSWIYFLIHAVKNPNFDQADQQNMRVIWILIIVLISGLGNLMYWIIEIKSKNPRPIIPS
jgi:amino acid transporter